MILQRFGIPAVMRQQRNRRALAFWVGGRVANAVQDGVINTVVVEAPLGA